MIQIRSATPFNITTGRDNNLDTLFNDRPAFGTAGDPNTVVTPYGVFKLNPVAGDLIIPRNFGEGSGTFTANLGISKTFGFGPPIGGAPARAATQSAQPSAPGTQQAQNSRGNRTRQQSGPAVAIRKRDAGGREALRRCSMLRPAGRGRVAAYGRGGNARRGGVVSSATAAATSTTSL